MSRSTKIKVSIPEGFAKTSVSDQEEYLFKHLKNIGFSKQNFNYPIEINEHDEALWEYHIEQLPEMQEEIDLDRLIGAYYLIHKVKPGALPYESLCKIIIELRGGLSIYHHRETMERSEMLDFRDNLQGWIKMVLDEPEDDLDIETRRAEFRQYIEILDKLSNKVQKNSTIYVTLTRPSSDIRKSLSLVEKKLTEIQKNEQINPGSNH